LAARWMGWETVAWVEIDKFCQQVLKKNFPEAKGYGDIKEFDGTQYRGAVDIITGGFPCQPFSTAGNRKGKEDHRYLWPEMLRVIREVQPAYIVGENVYGLVNWSRGLVFEQVCADLENEGYQVQPIILPACGVNAPHRRDRVWFVAYSESNDDRRAERELCKENGRPVGELLSAPIGAGEGLCGERATINSKRESNGRHNAGESSGIRMDMVRNIMDEAGRYEGSNDFESSSVNVANTNVCGLEGSENETPWKFTVDRNTWHQFPTQSPVCRGNDGIPNRVDRIKALGNSVVPQVVFEIFKAIQSIQ
jgi:DNA (cytosine-5)-methyltransferase 1